MKKTILTIVVLAGLSFNTYTSLYQKPKTVAKTNCGESPDLNKKIINYLNKNMGKQLGNGECWDVASKALNEVGAKWDKKFVFGKTINYKTDCVFAGDILQLSDAMLHVETTKGTHVYDEYPQHTAIVYEVKSKDVFIIADQNFGFNAKVLRTHLLDLKTLAKGTVQFYRPVK